MTLELPTIDIVGPGRMGLALSHALKAAGVSVDGPHGRDASCDGSEAVLLCVPDQEISSAAGNISCDALIGHCSGASTLAPLGDRRGFSLHPLMTVTNDGAVFVGATCAVAGSDEDALSFAVRLAEALSMRPVEIDDEDRAAYHAAASIASNFLVTLESAAERLGETVGLKREDFRPLVEASVANFFQLGEEALTGPIARGDSETVSRQREAIQTQTPSLLPLYDAMVNATREIATAGALK